jgi:hypothetical protein
MMFFNLFKAGCQYLEALLQHKTDMVVYEAANAICALPESEPQDLNPITSVLGVLTEGRCAYGQIEMMNQIIDSYFQITFAKWCWVLFALPLTRLVQKLSENGPTASILGLCTMASDLIHLVHLHELAILHSLRIRYDQDFIYTNTGPILIAVNPFITQSGRSLGGNSSRNLLQNESKVANSNANNAASKKDGANGRLEPHVYQTTDDAYRAMIRGIETSLLMQQSASSRRMSSSQVLALDIPPCNQSILVSGESGAGKTVTTKIVLNYLAVLSKRTEQFQKASGGLSSPSRRLLGKDPPDANTHHSSTTNVITIEQQVLQSNPIQEAFGNARTIRNDSSSRFGKYIDVHFTANGKLTGATIETYLLEKVRLLQPQQGESNYHVFYQLLCSATVQERSQFYLQDLQPHDFYLLQASDTYDRRDGVSDAEQHLEMLDAMITIGNRIGDRISLVPCALTWTISPCRMPMKWEAMIGIPTFGE